MKTAGQLFLGFGIGLVVLFVGIGFGILICFFRHCCS